MERNHLSAVSLGQWWAGSWPAARRCGVGSLCQGGAKEIASGLKLGVVEVHHGVLYDFGEVSLFLWASVLLSAKWKGLDSISECFLS